MRSRHLAGSGAAETTAGWTEAGVGSITLKVPSMRTTLDRLSASAYGLVTSSARLARIILSPKRSSAR
jgi:hypothetical protein